MTAWKRANPEKHAQNLLSESAKRKALTLSKQAAHQCVMCTKVFDGRARTCSRECELAFVRRAALERALALHRQEAKVIDCEECGTQFCPIYGASNAILCVPCMQTRKRAAHAMGKAVRKAKIRSVLTERVNPIKVLERDGWQCRLCGVATPQAKRGTYETNAPELDHRIPISKGGPHTYANTQCACRACNQAKGDSLNWAPPANPGGLKVQRDQRETAREPHIP